MDLKYGPYSPSRLDVATCPYSFWRQYVDPERTPFKTESLPQARGSVVHEVFEELSKGYIKVAPMHEGMRFEDSFVNRLVVEAVNRHPAAYQDLETIKSIVKLYLQRPPKVLTNDAEVEVRMALKWDGRKFVECGYDDPAATLRGRADIMMITDDLTSAYVYDHKTQPNTEDADTFQLGFYSLVILRSRPYLQSVNTVLHFARYGSYSEPHIWTAEALADIEEEIITRIEIIESKTKWDEAIPSKYCQYCPVIGECPIMKESFAVDEHGNFIRKGILDSFDGSTGGAVKLAQRLQVLEEVVKRDKDNLKEHVKNFGPIAIPGKRYDFKGETKVDWDRVNKTLRNHAYECFRKHGKDERDFMGFSQTMSTGIWRLGSEELIRDLNFPTKLTTEFRGYKI